MSAIMNGAISESRKAAADIRICVIGAGTAGLSALKNAIQKGAETICYEKSQGIGGTWVYNDNIEHIKNAEDVHSSMYEGLRTNLPKEIMGYPDFPYTNEGSDYESFITSGKVLNYLRNYAAHFQLHDHIKFQHEVIRVRPRSYANSDRKLWEVYVKNLQTKEYFQEYFDFIFVCNGHYTTPTYPDIENMNLFKGKQLHSHLYRKPSSFKDETVLIIGAGPSGIDIAHHLNAHTKRIFISHHLDPAPNFDSAARVVQKPDLQCFTDDGAIFKDGSRETFTVVIYCTGYKYTFPFISADCEVNIVENFVQPLHKHIININYPSMAFIGLPFKVCPTQLFDLQVRFALTYFLREKSLPSRSEMLAEFEADLQARLDEGLPRCRFHEMGKRQYEYYEDLSSVAGIEGIKPVICKIMKACSQKYIYDLESFRKQKYHVIDNETFSVC